MAAADAPLGRLQAGRLSRRAGTLLSTSIPVTVVKPRRRKKGKKPGSEPKPAQGRLGLQGHVPGDLCRPGRIGKDKTDIL